jgi:hypothetical protein
MGTLRLGRDGDDEFQGTYLQVVLENPQVFFAQASPLLGLICSLAASELYYSSTCLSCPDVALAYPHCNRFTILD